MDCIFCKIIEKESPADIIYEDGKFIAFKDINPSADLHILIVPKKHIKSINNLEAGERELMGDLILTAGKIAKEKNLTGYKLLINVGREGGQMIDHLHLHLLSGKSIKLP